MALLLSIASAALPHFGLDSSVAVFREVYFIFSVAEYAESHCG